MFVSLKYVTQTFTSSRSLHITLQLLIVRFAWVLW